MKINPVFYFLKKTKNPFFSSPQFSVAWNQGLRVKALRTNDFFLCNFSEKIKLHNLLDNRKDYERMNNVPVFPFRKKSFL